MYRVYAEHSDNGGSTWSPLISARGGTGENIWPGSHKIIWYLSDDILNDIWIASVFSFRYDSDPSIVPDKIATPVLTLFSSKKSQQGIERLSLSK